MKWRPAAVVLFGVGLAGWAVSHATCSKNGNRPQELGEFVIEGEVTVPGANENPTAATPPPVPPGAQVALMKDVTPTTKGKLAQRPELPFEYKKEIDLFSDMQKRLFLTEADQAEKRRLLNDTALLRALGLRLTEPSLSEAVVQSQDVAVDLLVEALKSGDRETASEVLKSVVEDPQVELPTMERGLREHMAGLKGEILLRWAALAPDQAANIERSLPGPVSRKIWENVRQRHESNRREGL